MTTGWCGWGGQVRMLGVLAGLAAAAAVPAQTPTVGTLLNSPTAVDGYTLFAPTGYRTIADLPSIARLEPLLVPPLAVTLSELELH